MADEPWYFYYHLKEEIIVISTFAKESENFTSYFMITIYTFEKSYLPAVDIQDVAFELRHCRKVFSSFSSYKYPNRN